MNVRRFLSASSIAPLLLAAPLTAQIPPGCPSPDSITSGLSGPAADVRYLTATSLQRAGESCAAGYVADRLGSLGLEPAGPGGRYFQTFTVRTGTALGGDNHLSIGGQAYASGRDWVPLGFSANAVIRGRLVYAGAELSEPGEAEVPSAGADLAGEIVVVDWIDPDAVQGRDSRSEGPYSKATVAAARHAAALVLLLPEGMALPDPQEEMRAGLPIPVVAVAGGSAAESVRQAALHREEASLSTDVRPVLTQARNVLALLPGTDSTLLNQYVIVGARFEDVPSGTAGPDAGDSDTSTHDDASGTAGLLDVAGRMVAGAPPGRSVLFIGFTGEGRGRWGSSYFVAHPTIDLSSVVAMLDLDRIGRMENNSVTVFGTGSAREWRRIVSAQNRMLASPLDLSFPPEGYGPADQASFHAEGIPVLHFVTGTDLGAPPPQVTSQGVDAPGVDRVAELAARVTRSLAGSPGLPPAHLTPVPQLRPDAAGGPERLAPPDGSGPYLGVVPGTTSVDFGVRIRTVEPGSPAEVAGLRAGDVIVELDGKDTPDVAAYRYAMHEEKAGKNITILVDRDARMVSVKATLLARPGGGRRQSSRKAFRSTGSREMRPRKRARACR